MLCTWFCGNPQMTYWTLMHTLSVQWFKHDSYRPLELKPSDECTIMTVFNVANSQKEYTYIWSIWGTPKYFFWCHMTYNILRNLSFQATSDGEMKIKLQAGDILFSKLMRVILASEDTDHRFWKFSLALHPQKKILNGVSRCILLFFQYFQGWNRYGCIVRILFLGCCLSHIMDKWCLIVAASIVEYNFRM